MNMKIVLDEQFTERSVRADLAWELFFRSKTEMPKGHSEPLLPFANWFWDEMGQRAGRLMKLSKGEATVTIPSLAPEALDFVVRLASFWADEVYLRKRGSLSGNMWRRPVVNVLDDDTLEGAERPLTSRKETGSIDRFLMPLLGPGRLLPGQTGREGRERCSIPQSFARGRILLDPHREGDTEIQWF